MMTKESLLPAVSPSFSFYREVSRTLHQVRSRFDSQVVDWPVSQNIPLLESPGAWKLGKGFEKVLGMFN